MSLKYCRRYSPSKQGAQTISAQEGPIRSHQRFFPFLIPVDEAGRGRVQSNPNVSCQLTLIGVFEAHEAEKQCPAPIQMHHLEIQVSFGLIDEPQQGGLSMSRA